jgi:magnesium transporter
VARRGPGGANARMSRAPVSVGAAGASIYNGRKRLDGGDLLRIYLQDDKGTVSEPDSLDNVALAGSSLLWVDIDDPGGAPDQLKGTDFQVDLPGFVELEGTAANPRIQQRSDDLLIIWSHPGDFDEQSQRLLMSPILIVFRGNLLVTLHRGSDEMEQVRDDFKRGDFENPLYSILDATAMADLDLSTDVSRDIDSYLDSIMGVGRKTGSRRQREQYDVNEIKRLKRRNVEVRKLVTAHRNVLLRLTRRGTRFVSAELARDLMDVVEQYWRIDDDVQNNSDLITASLDIQLNVTMKRLTTIATIFMPLTFLVGLYGMNFRHMPELTWRYGYLFAWITMLVIAVAMIIYARRKGWF